MSDAAIRAEHLSKRYWIGGKQERYKALRDVIAETCLAPFRRVASVLKGQGTDEAKGEIWALKDVSFEVQRGEVLGIIGRNGAGKSTLLKVLSRITEPTEGCVEIHGRVGSLLEVGTGFHPELTGRENVFLNGAILGMKRAEIERKFDEIVDFADIEKFIDTPVKHYSSGMYMRLAFAVAAHLEPDILLVDEVLSVGDAVFQNKCLGKMDQVSRSGRTVFFVSHNMNAIEGLCTKGILLENGNIRLLDKPQRVIQEYIGQQKVAPTADLSNCQDRTGDRRVLFTSFNLLDCALKPINTAQAGKALVFALGYRLTGGQTLQDVSLEIGIYSTQGILIVLFGNGFAENELLSLPPSGRILCRLSNFPLSRGMYDVNLFCAVKGHIADWIKQAARFQVIEGDFFGTGRVPPAHAGLVMIEHKWSIDNAS